MLQRVLLHLAAFERGRGMFPSRPLPVRTVDDYFQVLEVSLRK